MENNKKEAEQWIKRIRRTEKINKKKREETNAYKKAYTGDFSYNKDSSIDKYTVKVNFIYYFVETIMPSIFASEPKVRVKPKKDPSLAKSAALNEYNTNYWAKELGSRGHFKNALFDSFFGPAAIYSGWRYETEMKTVSELKKDQFGIPLLVDGLPQLEDVEKEIVLKDQPLIKWLDFWEEVRVDPDVKHTRDARWMAIRITVTEDEFKETQNIKEEYRTGPKAIKATMRPEDMNDEPAARDENKSDAEWVTYWEVWDREKMERKFIHEKVNDDFLNEDISWPFEFEIKDDPFPITILHAKPDPFSNMSFSEFRPVEDQIWERVRLRSVQAAVVRRLAPKWLYAKGAGTKEQIKKLQNSSILSANELNNPALLSLAPMPEIPATFLQWDSIVEQDIGNASGLSEFERQRLANTATEASISEGRSNVRKDARTNEWEEFVVTVLAKVGHLCQQLQNKENVLMIDGAEFEQEIPKVFAISREQLQGEFDFDMIAGTMSHGNEATELQNLLKFYELTLQDPNPNHRYLIEQICDYMGLDPKMALLSPEAMQAKAQQQQQAQQAQAMAHAQAQAHLQSMKDKIKFAPIDINEVVNPMDRIRIIEAAKQQNDVASLSSGPMDAAQAQLSQLSQAGQQMGVPPGPHSLAPPSQPGASPANTSMPMNASHNMVGSANPSTAVHPNSLTSAR